MLLSTVQWSPSVTLDTEKHNENYDNREEKTSTWEYQSEIEKCNLQESMQFNCTDLSQLISLSLLTYHTTTLLILIQITCTDDVP